MPDSIKDQANEVYSIIENGPDPGAGGKATEMFLELFGVSWWEILWSGQEILVELGDLIILEVGGEIYPCDPKLFEKTYGLRK